MFFLPTSTEKKNTFQDSTGYNNKVRPRLSESLRLQDAAVPAAALQSWHSCIILQQQDDAFQQTAQRPGQQARRRDEAAARGEALSQRWRKEANRTIKACQGTSCDSVLLPVVLPVLHPDVFLPCACACVCACLVFCFMATEQLGNHQHHHQSCPTSPPPPPSQQLNKSQDFFLQPLHDSQNATLMPIYHTVHCLISNNKRKTCLKAINLFTPGASVFWIQFYSFGSLSTGWCQYIRFTFMGL